MISARVFPYGIVPMLVVLAGVAMTGTAAAQGSVDRAQFDARMNVLQRSLGELSAQVEQLKAQDQQLQMQLERMRDRYDRRLERLEKGTVPKGTPRRTNPS